MEQGASGGSQAVAESETINEMFLTPPQDLIEQSTERSHTTLTSQSAQPSFLVLRTVPLFLKNGNHRIKVNALLDNETAFKCWCSCWAWTSRTSSMCNCECSKWTDWNLLDYASWGRVGKFGWKCEDYHKCIHSWTSHRKHESYWLGKVCSKVHPF